MPQNHLSLPLLIAVAFALLVVGLLLLIAHACQTHVLSCTLKQFLKCEYFKYDWRPSSTTPCYLRQIMWSLFLGAPFASNHAVMGVLFWVDICQPYSIPKKNESCFPLEGASIFHIVTFRLSHSLTRFFDASHRQLMEDAARHQGLKPNEAKRQH